MVDCRPWRAVIKTQSTVLPWGSGLTSVLAVLIGGVRFLDLA